MVFGGWWKIHKNRETKIQWKNNFNAECGEDYVCVIQYCGGSRGEGGEVGTVFPSNLASVGWGFVIAFREYTMRRR